MIRPALITLLQNAALLLAMVVLFDIATSHQQLKGKPLRQAFVGIILGGIGIGLILLSFRIEPGIVFDTRSVLLSVSGLFLGPLPTVVAMIILSIFRFSQGGAGVWMGISVIIATGGLGMVWRHYRPRPLTDISWHELFVFGVVVHLVMLSLMLMLPWESARRVFPIIGPSLLLVYPAATAALGLLLANRLQREQATLALADSENRYRSLFENNHAAMLIINPVDSTIVDANPAACQFYGWTRQQLQQMLITQINALSPEAIQAEMNRAKASHNDRFLFQHRRADGSLRDVEVFSGPITVGGKPLLYSIIHDITERKQAEQKIQEQLNELRRWQEATLGRETRVLELKQEVNGLLARAGLPARYTSVVQDSNLPAESPILQTVKPEVGPRQVGQGENEPR